MSNTFEFHANRLLKELDELRRQSAQKDKMLESLKENYRQDTQKLKLEIDDLQQTLANYDAQTVTLDDETSRTLLENATTEYFPRKPNIAVIVGHDHLVQGAWSKHLNQTEWDFWNEEIRALKILPENLQVFYRDRNGINSAHQKIKDSITEFDFAIELHFNAYRVQQANGAEILTAARYRDFEVIAENVLERWCSATEIRNRGLKFPTEGTRGHTNVNNLGIPTFLLEPFFGTNPSDCLKMRKAGNLFKTFINLFTEEYVAINSQPYAESKNLTS